MAALDPFPSIAFDRFPAELQQGVLSYLEPTDLKNLRPVSAVLDESVTEYVSHLCKSEQLCDASGQILSPETDPTPALAKWASGQCTLADPELRQQLQRSTVERLDALFTRMAAVGGSNSKLGIRLIGGFVNGYQHGEWGALSHVDESTLSRTRSQIEAYTRYLLAEGRLVDRSGRSPLQTGSDAQVVISRWIRGEVAWRPLTAHAGACYEPNTETTG